tara:strand:+ start:225 stop:530 length:306 start_codon:yes stop_codon:yes gene_type:complete
LIISVERAEGRVDPFEDPKRKEYDNNDRNQMKKYSELINHPKHYNQGKIEVIDAIVDWELDFIEGNVVKYVARSKHKSSRAGDLKKARWYLDYLIKQLEKE